MTFFTRGDFGVYPRLPLHRSMGTSASAAKSCIRSQDWTVNEKGSELKSARYSTYAAAVKYFREAKTRQEAESAGVFDPAR